MANKSFKEKIQDFLSDRKKLTLLLLLLGGGGVVTTSVALLASNPASSQPAGSSQVSGSSGITTSNPGSSAPLTSLDGELPDLNFDNAEIQFDGDVGLNFGFDRTWGSFYNQNYLYQVGVNFFDGVEVTQNNWEDVYLGIVAFNFETNEIDFEYTLDPGQTYIDAVVADTVQPISVNSFSGVEIYGNRLYFLLNNYVGQNSDIELGGDYVIINDYLKANFGDITNEYYNVFVSFDLAQPSSYRVEFAIERNFGSSINSFTFLNNELHLLASSRNLINSRVDASLDFINTFTLPNDIEAEEFFVSYTIHPINSNLTFANQRYETFFYASSTDIVFYIQNARFTPVSEGLIYTYFDESGNPFISLNFYILESTQTTFANLEERIGKLTGISGVSSSDLDEIKSSLTTFYTSSMDETYVSESTRVYVQANITGLFSLTNNAFSFNFLSNAWFNHNYTDVDNYAYQANYYSSLVKIDTTYLITQTLQRFTYKVNFFYGMIYDNEGTELLDHSSTVARFDSVANTKTPLTLAVNDLYSISGLYPRDGGYYLSATLVESDTNGIEGLAAGLFVLDENFAVESSLVFDGSRSDIGNIMSINSRGQLIWIIYSSSTDGDFAGALASNALGEYKQYAVYF